MSLHQPARSSLPLAVLGTAAFIAGCSPTETPEYNEKPGFIGTVTSITYDGTTDDLLTGGLGKSGLQGTTGPVIVDVNAPNATELRKLAIYNNYRAMVDTTTSGGFGVLYGPNVDIGGNPFAVEGLIAGTEYTAYIGDGTGQQSVAMIVQVPNVFASAAPCIVTATSSGSRGVYGAIATVGEWGLKHGCAVAYVDKGTGVGVHDLASNTVNVMDGTRKDAATAGNASNFTANMTAAERTAYNTAFPNRIAIKHAHSQSNPEKDWGQHTLQAVEFALYVLNERFAPKVNGRPTLAFKPNNVIVIASSVGNGAGAALAALEQDTKGLIDGLAVSQPNVQMAANNTLSVKRGAVTLTGTGRPLMDYFTLANLLQPCAAKAAEASGAFGAPGGGFVNDEFSANRCAALKARGILTASTPAAQSSEALAQLVAYGWQPESNLLHASHYAFATPGTTLAHANSYGRFGVRDNLCGYSFAATGADFRPATATAVLPRIFATGNGAAPMAGINIINNLAVGGAILDTTSVTASTNLPDYNVDGALCLRGLFTGSDANAARVQSGMAEVRRTGNLRGKPAVIVHGRADAMIPPSFTSRPYFGLNKIAEGGNSKLSYIEVTNAQHFDAFIGSTDLPGYDTSFVPLHRYFQLALDAVYNNLRAGTALPPSQVVRTTPRGGFAGQAPAIAATNVPVFSATPAATEQITFSNNLVTIPD